MRNNLLKPIHLYLVQILKPICVGGIKTNLRSDATPRRRKAQGNAHQDREIKLWIWLVADILDGDPFKGIGKPEPLKYIASDTWSRRIDLEHRLVYKVKSDRVYFLQARYHYQKGD